MNQNGSLLNAMSSGANKVYPTKKVHQKNVRESNTKIDSTGCSQEAGKYYMHRFGCPSVLYYLTFDIIP
jgi:hypothetical protein